MTDTECRWGNAIHERGTVADEVAVDAGEGDARGAELVNQEAGGGADLTVGDWTV